MQRIEILSDSVLQVIWGESSMIEAERLLLSAALEDPANQRFVLLSDRSVGLSFRNLTDEFITFLSDWPSGHYMFSLGVYLFDIFTLGADFTWQRFLYKFLPLFSFCVAAASPCTTLATYTAI